MKKSFFFVLGLLLSISAYSQIQFNKDTIFLEEKPVGYLSDLISEESTIWVNGKEMTGPVVTYTISLFRTITYDEQKQIEKIYDPELSQYINVRFLEDLVFSSNQAKAGYLIYEAGKLKTQSYNLFLVGTATSTLATVISTRILYQTISSFMLNQPGVSVPGMEYRAPTKLGKAAPYLMLSFSTAISISAISKQYKANQKLKEAGILLQKQ
jgi:hypothetical protein